MTPAPARIFALVLTLLVAGCTEPSLQQLYVPATSGAGYGYAERMLPGAEAVVTYDAPLDSAFSYAEIAGQQIIDANVNRAYDLALMRAADLTLSKGLAGFRVTNRTNDVNVRRVYNPPFYGYGYPYYGRYGHPFYYGGAGFPINDSYEVLYTRVTLNVTFEKRVEKGVFNAAEVRTTIGARYAPKVGQ